MEIINDSKQLLTVAIPTYNRVEYLRQCLDHVCPQINDKVKVVVRDNKSTNYDFFEFIKPYEDKYGVEGVQNEINIGGDANFARLFETCKTKWIWILGDDDYIKEDAIGTIIDVLENHQDDLFVRFESSYDGQIKGIDGFATAMAGMSEFAGSFFISIGFHNLEKGKSDLLYSYQFLSMKISQIIRVMMHLRYFPETTCYFTSQQILKDHGEDVSWKHDDMIIPYLNVFDVFRLERKVFRDNIFRCVAGKLMHYVTFSDLSFSDKLYYWHQIFVKYGYYNTLRYNLRNIIGVFYRKFVQ